MKRHVLFLAALVAALAFGAAVARAGNVFELTRSGIDVSAGFMNNDTFQLDGGAFQPDVGTLTDATYSLTGGLFSDADPIQALLNPLGTTVWQIGTKVDVTWWNDLVAAGCSVRVELWRDNAKVMDLFSDYDPSGNNVRRIVVPNVLPGSGYQLRTVSTVLEALGHPNAAMTSQVVLSIAIRNAVPARSWALYE